MRRRFRIPLVLLVLAAAVPSRPARADGPHIAFHGTEGAYSVTLFSAPDPLVAGPVQFSLLVQNAADGTIASTASATGQLTLPGQPAAKFVFAPGAGGNPRLPGAAVRLPMPGSYGLTLQVANRTGAEARFTGTLPVAADNGKRNTVFWAVLIPLAAALLFLANQYGKQHLDEARTRARAARL